MSLEDTADGNRAFRLAGVEGQGPNDRWMVTLALAARGERFTAKALAAVASPNVELRCPEERCGLTVVDGVTVLWQIGHNRGSGDGSLPGWKRSLLVGLPIDKFHFSVSGRAY